jgi:hypothetical protein
MNRGAQESKIILNERILQVVLLGCTFRNPLLVELYKIAMN